MKRSYYNYRAAPENSWVPFSRTQGEPSLKIPKDGSPPHPPLKMTVKSYILPISSSREAIACSGKELPKNQKTKTRVGKFLNLISFKLEALGGK